MAKISSCFDPMVRSNELALDKILLLDYLGENQNFIEKVLVNYSRQRDFHNSPPSLGPMIHIAIFIVTAANATLVSRVNINPDCDRSILRNIPTLHNFCFGAHLRELYSKIGDVYGDGEMPTPISRFSAPFGFMYCGRPRRVLQNFSPIQLLTAMRDPSVWLGIMVCIILLILILRLRIGKGSASLFLVTLSPLLSTGMSIKSGLKYSWLLTLWMLTSVIFVTYYSGNLTCHVISPTKEPRMTRVGDLRKNNYSLITNHPYKITTLKNLARISGSYAGITQEMINATKAPPSDKELPKWVATMDGHACVSSWPGAHECLSRGELYIKENKIENRRCYLGKELFFDQPIFIVVTPPQSTRLANIAWKMMEGGFFSLWFNEFAGISATVRVQDRVKMLSRTKVMEEQEQPRALNMKEGKLKIVFIMSIMILSLSVVAFTLENICAHMKLFY